MDDRQVFFGLPGGIFYDIAMVIQWHEVAFLALGIEEALAFRYLQPERGRKEPYDVHMLDPPDLFQAMPDILSGQGSQILTVAIPDQIDDCIRIDMLIAFHFYFTDIEPRPAAQ